MSRSLLMRCLACVRLSAQRRRAVRPVSSTFQPRDSRSAPPLSVASPDGAATPVSHADQVFYGHVLGFKGLERRAVVLVVNEESAFERSRERLYVGLSRVRDQLVVRGDPEFVRQVGGSDLAHRLHLPSI